MIVDVGAEVSSVGSCRTRLGRVVVNSTVSVSTSTKSVRCDGDVFVSVSVSVSVSVD